MSKVPVVFAAGLEVWIFSLALIHVANILELYAAVQESLKNQRIRLLKLEVFENCKRLILFIGPNL